MKKIVGLMLVGGALLAMPSASSLYAGGLGDMMQKMIGDGYTDADGDGLNDRITDADGDGIPNWSGFRLCPPAGWFRGWLR